MIADNHSHTNVSKDHRFFCYEWQMRWIKVGLSPNLMYGDVSDLDIQRWDDDQMRAVALGRGCLRSHGDISDLTPELWTADEMLRISVQRGSRNGK